MLFEGGCFLFEDLLGEHRQIDAPVAPDVAAVGLDVLVVVTLAVPVVTQVDGALVEEVGLTHTHPVELGLAAEELCALLLELGIGLDLLGKGILVTALGQVQTCGEEAKIIELVGVEHPVWL